jgi:hypothetical protein
MCAESFTVKVRETVSLVLPISPDILRASQMLYTIAHRGMSVLVNIMSTYVGPALL